MLQLTHISKTKTLALCATLFLSSALSAQDFSAFEPIKENRPETPQDFSIAGISNGMTPDDAKTAMEEHFDKEVAFETGLLKISSSDGKGAQFDLKTRIVTPWIGPMQRASSNPYDEINVILGTKVLDEQVIKVFRTLKLAEADRPSPSALRAQIEEEFGSASFVQISGRDILMFYAVDTNGIIDYTEFEGQHHSFERFMESNSDKTCLSREAVAEYSYRYPREPSSDTDCLLTYLVTTSPVDGIRFSLTDHALQRFNITESDKQVDAALNAETKPSELEL